MSPLFVVIYSLMELSDIRKSSGKSGFVVPLMPDLSSHDVRSEECFRRASSLCGFGKNLGGL